MWVWAHPNQLFSAEYISALRGCWPLKFLHILEIDQGLLAHTTNRAGVPQNFKGKHLKLGLKFHICAPITLGVVGVTSRNYAGMWLVAKVITWTLILQGVPLQNLGWQKPPKFSAIFDNFRLRSRISLEWIDETRKSGKHLINYISSPIGCKKWWTLVHEQESYSCTCRLTQVDFFRDTKFQTLWGAGPSNFYTC